MKDFDEKQSVIKKQQHLYARSTCKHWLGTSAYVKRGLFNIIT